MSQPDDALDVLRAVWSAEGQTSTDLDEACGTKSCKKMADVRFYGLAGARRGKAKRGGGRRRGPGRRPAGGPPASDRPLTLSEPEGLRTRPGRERRAEYGASGERR